MQTSEHVVCKDMTVSVNAAYFTVNDGPRILGGKPMSFQKGDKVKCWYADSEGLKDE